MTRKTLRRLFHVGIAGLVLVPLLWLGIVYLGLRAAGTRLRAEREAVIQAQDRLLWLRRDGTGGSTTQNSEGTVVVADEPSVTTTLQALDVIGDRVGAELDSLQALTTQEGGKQDYRIVGRGTMTRLCQFLAALESHGRLVLVETARVAPATESTVAFELAVATFHRGGEDR